MLTKKHHQIGHQLDIGEWKNTPKDIAFGRLNVFADDDVPDEIVGNISNVIDPGAVPKRLSEYSQEEIDSFPKIFEESMEHPVFDDPDASPQYYNQTTMRDHMGPSGSVQAKQFRKDLNLEDYSLRPDQKVQKRSIRYKNMKTKFV